MPAAACPAPQRADVMGLAQTWVREGTGAIVADVPVDTPNARAAAASFQEIRALLAAGGVPSRAITLHHYRPDDLRTLPTIRLSYPRIAAVAGPCGLWPQDLGPNHLTMPATTKTAVPQFRLRHPAQPRGDDRQSGGPRAAAARDPRLYGAARYAAFEKYRKGVSTTTTYPEADKAKLSDTGK